jgi:ribosome-binding ATPase YchF (GTP1/OBG family)
MLVKEPDPLKSTILLVPKSFRRKKWNFLEPKQLEKVHSVWKIYDNEKKKNSIQNVLKLNIKTLKPIIISMNTNKDDKARFFPIQLILFWCSANFSDQLIY